MSAISGTLPIASIQRASVGKSVALPWNVMAPLIVSGGGASVVGVVVAGAVLPPVGVVVGGATGATGTGGVDAAAKFVSEIPAGKLVGMRLIIFSHEMSVARSVVMSPESVSIWLWRWS